MQPRPWSRQILWHQVHQAPVGILQDNESEEPGDDHDEGHGHLEERTDDRSHAGRTKAVGCEDALHDEEVGRPVGKTDGEAKAEDDAGPVNAHWIVSEMTHAAPHMRVVAGSGYPSSDVMGELRFETVPAARFNEAQDRDQQCAAPDEHELQHFIEDCRAQTAESHVGGNGQRGNDDREVEIPAEDDLHNLSHGEHVHAAHENRHEGKGNGSDDARSLPVAKFEVSGHRVGFADVVERHHHHAQKEHGWNGAYPVPVRREDAVLICGTGPSHELERTEVCGNEAEAGDPGGHLAPGHEEFFAGVGFLLKVEADPDDHHEVDRDDCDIEGPETRQRRGVHDQGQVMGGVRCNWCQCVHSFHLMGDCYASTTRDGFAP